MAVRHDGAAEPGERLVLRAVVAERPGRTHPAAADVEERALFGAVQQRHVGGDREPQRVGRRVPVEGGSDGEGHVVHLGVDPVGGRVRKRGDVPVDEPAQRGRRRLRWVLVGEPLAGEQAHQVVQPVPVGGHRVDQAGVDQPLRRARVAGQRGGRAVRQVAAGIGAQSPERPAVGSGRSSYAVAKLARTSRSPS